MTCPIHICDMTHSYVRRGSFFFVCVRVSITGMGRFGNKSVSCVDRWYGVCGCGCGCGCCMCGVCGCYVSCVGVGGRLVGGRRMVGWVVGGYI